MDSVWMLWDIIAVVVLIYTVNRCAYRGLVRVLLGLLGCVVAAILAAALREPLALLLYNNVVEDILRIVITNRLEGAALEGASLPSELMLALPFILQPMVQQSGTEILQTFLGGSSEELTRLLLEALRDPVLSVLEGVTFFAVFSLVLWLARHFSRMFTGLGRLPVIGTANTVLGGVVGVAQGVLILYFLAVLAHVVVILTGGEIAWLNDTVLDQTFIFRVFYHIG